MAKKFPRRANPILGYRKRNKITQQDLAMKLGVSVRTVWEWENYHFPGRLARLRLKEICGIELDPEDFSDK